MADILTGTRIVCGILILIFPCFSKCFWLLYVFGGLTDAVDGTVARKLGKASESGAVFDTAADAVFALTVIFRLLTDVKVPLWMIICAAAVGCIKAFNILYGCVKYRQFITVHSSLNRICGAVLYFTPLLFGFNLTEGVRNSVTAVFCILAAAAAFHENSAVRNYKISDTSYNQS